MGRDAPGLFDLNQDRDQPGRHVFVISTDEEQLELVGTLDAFVVVAHELLAAVASERFLA